MQPHSTARSRMTMRTDVLRNVSTGTDAYNNLLPPSFQVYRAGVPCFAWNRASREVIDGDKTAVVEDLRVMVPIDAEVTEKDRLTTVTDRRGQELFPGPFTIDSAPVRKAGHLELVLRRAT